MPTPLLDISDPFHINDHIRSQATAPSHGYSDSATLPLTSSLIHSHHSQPNLLQPAALLNGQRTAPVTIQPSAPLNGHSESRLRDLTLSDKNWTSNNNHPGMIKKADAHWENAARLPVGGAYDHVAAPEYDSVPSCGSPPPLPPRDYHPTAQEVSPLPDWCLETSNPLAVKRI